MPDHESTYFKGRGAQINTTNPYSKDQYSFEHIEGLDEDWMSNSKTEYYFENPKKIINKVESLDLVGMYSMNPYQGCEHGCIYCYARNTHQYWGFSAGLDFERKIIIKHNAAEVLEKQLQSPRWEVHPIMFSGNTDCYQPIERKLGITRKMLEVLLKYKHPASMITKNALILRDIDLLKELNNLNLIHVSITITSLDEELRQMLEPRTSTYKNRLNLVKELSESGLDVNVMMAPIIPGINSHEIPELIKQAAEMGAVSAAYTIVRLNGAIADIFSDWVRKNFPDRAEKVLHQIAECHNGKLNDSRFGKRMRGDGKVAESMAQMFRIAKNKYMKGRKMKELNCNIFNNNFSSQLKLF
jgi:DNA repair photolyase